MSINVIKTGSRSSDGFDLNGDGSVDVTFDQYKELQAIAKKKQEVKHLNEYQAYYSTSEGDVPVTCVAANLIEAAKIFSKSGAFKDTPMEPISIKFLKNTIAVAVPTHNIGIKTYISPSNASDSGAVATPKVATVENGTDVIFEAVTPYGWEFAGWTVGDSLANGATVISTEERVTMEVWDQNATILEYYANFTFKPALRSGRYMNIKTGVTYAFNFDSSADGTYKGYMNVGSSNDVNVNYFVFTALEAAGDAEGTWNGTFKTNPIVTQVGGDINGTCLIEANAVGLTITWGDSWAESPSIDDWVATGTTTLRYVSELKA